MGKNDEISELPGLEDISNLFPPSAPASSTPVANVSMKLPAFQPDAADVRSIGHSVRDPKRFGQQD